MNELNWLCGTVNYHSIPESADVNTNASQSKNLTDMVRHRHSLQ